MGNVQTPNEKAGKSQHVSVFDKTDIGGRRNEVLMMGLGPGSLVDKYQHFS